MPLFDLYSNLPISKHLIDCASSWADVIILHNGTEVADYALRRYDLLCVPFFHIDKFDPYLFGALRWVATAYTYPLRVLESKCVRSVPLAFANSRSLSDRVRKYTKGGKVITIPLGVDVDRLCPTYDDREFILMSGRLHPTNNFELGLAAACKTPYKMVIAGIHEERFSRYYRHLRRLVEQTKELRNQVEFVTPSDDELISLKQNCSIFLSPRKYDYLGLAALEAMACGKPVIAYKTKEGIEGRPPILTSGDQACEWQESIETLMGDKGLRRKIGTKARQFVEENHTWRNTVDLMLDRLKEKL